MNTAVEIAPEVHADGGGRGLEAAPDTVRVGPWALSLVLILAAAVYVDSLSYQFVWDDLMMVVQNRNLRDARKLPQLLWADFTTLTSGAIEGRYYRPTLAISLALDARLWGLNPAAFHLTNILLHVLTTLLVSRLVLALGGRRDTAVLAALIFAIHPAHVETVVFVSARSDLLPTLAVLACLLAYRHAATPGRHRTAWSLAALVANVLALLSKESTIVLPALLVLGDLLASRPSRAPADRGAWPRALIRSLPFWGVTVIFALWRSSTLPYLAGDRLQIGSLWHRAPGSLEILVRYLWLSLFPTHMQPFYSLPRPGSLLDPGPALGMVVAGLLVGLLIWWWRRAPLAAFGVGWFLISVIPVLDLVPLSFREMGLADRYLYLPSVGVALLVALGLNWLMGSAPGWLGRARRSAGWGTIILLLTLFPWSLLRYAPVWRNNLALYTRMEQVAPRSPNPPLNLGLTYFRANDLPHATVALERAVLLNPSLQRPRTILALLYVLQGRTSDGFRIFDAVRSEGLPDRDYYVARTTAHLYAGQPSQGLAIAEEGLPRFPDDPDLLQWLGRALEQAGRPDEAMQRYRQALAMAPDLFQAEEALGHLLARAGRPDEATQHLLRSAEIQPDRPQPIRALALLLETQGDRSESLRLWRQVLELAPNGAAIREAAGHIRSLERDGADSRVPPAGTRQTPVSGP